MAEKEYLVKKKCFFNGSIKNIGEVVFIDEKEKINPDVFCLRKEYKTPEAEPEFLPKSNGGIMAKANTVKSKREKLEQQARIFGIKFTKNTDTDELESLIRNYQAK